ncbi:MAG: protein kinase domain-containing protein, partial [Candidatus Fonsibacter sp.]
MHVWSARVVLYTCLTGKVPFKSGLEIIESDYLRSPLCHITEEARDLIAGMLEKEPEKRLSFDQCVQHQWIACSEADGCTINWDVLEEAVKAQPKQPSIRCLRSLNCTMFSFLLYCTTWRWQVSPRIIMC